MHLMSCFRKFAQIKPHSKHARCSKGGLSSFNFSFVLTATVVLFVGGAGHPILAGTRLAITLGFLARGLPEDLRLIYGV
jgi:hypothetical protein